MMKRLLLALSMVMLFSIAAFAQFELKPTVGINFSSLSEDPQNGETSANVGWQAGLGVLYGTKFYGEAGVYWLKKTTEVRSTSSGAFEDFDADLSGFRIPLAVGYHLLGSEEENFALRVFGGGSLFLVVDEADAFDDFNVDVQGTQWGVFAGAGIDIWKLFLDVKYEWSLTDVNSVTEFDIGKSRSFFINAGFRFNF